MNPGAPREHPQGDHSGPVTVAVSLAIVAGAWWLHWHTVVGGPWRATVAVLLAAIAMTLASARLLHELLPGRHCSFPGAVAATAATGVVLLATALIADVLGTPGPMGLGAVAVIVLVGLHWVIVRPSPADSAPVALVAGLWLVGLAWWSLTTGVPAAEELIWSTSDQVMYLRISDELLRWEFARVPYLLGIPVLLAPGVLVAGEPGTVDTGMANTVNLLALPLTIGLLMPAMLVLCGRAVSVACGRPRAHWAMVVGAVSTLVVLFAYVSLPPDFLPERNAMLVPRRILGLVYAPESVSLLYLSVLLLALARTGRHPQRSLSPVTIGIATAAAIMVREYNAVLAVGFIVLLALSRQQRVTALWTGVVSAVAFVPQLIHWHVAYGSLLLPNRLVLWGDSTRPDHWRPIVEERYGWSPPGDVPQMSPRYVSLNLSDWWGSYGWLLGLLALVFVLLMVTRRGQWALWCYSAGLIAVTMLFNSAYINIDVTFRYNSIVLPAVGVLIGAALLVVYDRVSLGTWRPAPVLHPPDRTDPRQNSGVGTDPRDHCVGD